jgi:hypothetical protein
MRSTCRLIFRGKSRRCGASRAMQAAECRKQQEPLQSPSVKGQQQGITGHINLSEDNFANLNPPR